MQHKLYILLFLFPILIISCNKKSDKNSFQELKAGEVIELSGEELAKMYCGSCHLYAEPKLLDKNTWKYGTLPQMGYRMGIYDDTPRQSLIESNPGGRLVVGRKIFPPKPVIDEKQWKLIHNYYYENAPDSLTIPVKDLQMGINGLKVEIPEFHISPPMVTAIKYHPELNQIFVADAKADYSTINILDHNLESVSTLAVPSTVSHVDYKSDTLLATLMGSFMPTDNPSGSIIKIFKEPDGNEYKGFTTILKNLQRPVHTTYSDINGDKLEDIIVCEYGNYTGKLSLFVNRTNDQYEQKILSDDPGATTVVIRDLNKDGLPDIIALMAQGRERIDVHYNQGRGNFNASTVMNFPPSYGSVSISMLDWNNDGYEDIVYVNGDNADYSMTPKPYHGLRILLNDGENRFQETFFQHINGAYKAISHDFDNDGDRDIAVVSFFPDLINTKEEGFIYMENVSNEDSILFDLRTFDQGSSGRWITMEVTDLDKNSFPELILGSFTGMGINGDLDGKVGMQFVENSPTLMLLKFDDNFFKSLYNE